MRTLTAAALAAVALLSGCGGEPGPAAPAHDARLADAATGCRIGWAVADNESTLTLTTNNLPGVEPPTVSVTTAACTLNALHVPARVSSEIGRTTEAMGVQRDSWEGIDASWSSRAVTLNVILTLHTPNR